MTRRFLVAFALLLALGPLAFGEDEPIGEPAPMPTFPAGPGALEAPDGKDWIVLTSGEWLYGTVTRLRIDELTFKSEKVGERVFDLDDIRELCARNPYTYVVGDDLEEVTGPARLIGDELVVVTEDGPRRFPRDELISAIPKAESELDYWTARIELSITGTTGNSEQVTGNFRADAVRRDSITRLATSYLSTYGLSDNEEVARAHLGTLQLDAFVSKNLYIIPITARAQYDKFQNVDIRASAGAGAGYYLFHDPGLEWALEATGGYTYTEFRRTQPGERSVRKSTQLRLATRVDVDITDDITFRGLYEAFVGLSDIQDTFHHAEANIYVDLIDDTLKLSIGYVFDRQERTERRADGTLPHKDDMRYSVGLVLDL